MDYKAVKLEVAKLEAPKHQDLKSKRLEYNKVTARDMDKVESLKEVSLKVELLWSKVEYLKELKELKDLLLSKLKAESNK